MFALVMILDWSVDHEENYNVLAMSSIGSNHCCCSTHRPPIECGGKVVPAQLMCDIPSRANLHTGYSSCWVPGDIISYPFYDL